MELHDLAKRGWQAATDLGHKPELLSALRKDPARQGGKGGESTTQRGFAR